MTCRDICQKIKALKFKVHSPYQNGYRYCRRCEVFVQTGELFYPCCRMQLRRTPVKAEAKIPLRR